MNAISTKVLIQVDSCCIAVISLFKTPGLCKSATPVVLAASSVARFLNLERVDYCYMNGGFIGTEMGLLHSLLNKLGLRRVNAERHPIRVFLLDDDKRRHRWFSARFKGDFVDVADNVKEA